MFRKDKLNLDKKFAGNEGPGKHKAGGTSRDERGTGLRPAH